MGMDQILEDVKEVVSTADDTIVYGCTEEEHDACLCYIMQIACTYGLVFNAGKNETWKLRALCCLIADMIVKSMLWNKVNATADMPAPNICQGDTGTHVNGCIFWQFHKMTIWSSWNSVEADL